MSKERAPVQIIGISPNIETARKLQVMWGVHSCHAKDAHDTKEMVSIACTVAKEKSIAKLSYTFFFSYSASNTNHFFCIMGIFSMAGMHSPHYLKFSCSFNIW